MGRRVLLWCGLLWSVHALLGGGRGEPDSLLTRQYWEGTHVSLDSVQPGDLIFWSSDGSAGSIYHVAIYLGNDQMIEAPTFGVPVRVTGVRYSGIMPYAVRL